LTRQPAEQLEDVLDHIYAAALDPTAWQGAVERASDLIGAESALLFVMDWPRSGSVSVVAQHRIDPAAIRQWQSHYVPYDIWSHAMRALGNDFVATGASVVAPQELRRSLIYNDILSKLRWADVLAASLARGRGVECPISFYSERFFQPPQMKMLQRLAPHLRTALRLQFQLGALQRRVADLEEIVEHVSVGVMTLGRDGGLIWANERARAILDRHDGLALCDRRLRCARVEDTSWLDAAIRAASESVDGAAVGQALSVSRPSGRRSLGLIVSPLRARNAPPSPLAAVAPRAAAVLVTLSDPEQQVELLPERLARIFHLTPAEARLAAALATQSTLKQYAEDIGITIGTARWTLKRVLEKTGCRGQTGLVSLILRSAAGMMT
jgi:DNA-binding CsgD family transcriptional regulator